MGMRCATPSFIKFVSIAISARHVRSSYHNRMTNLAKSEINT